MYLQGKALGALAPKRNASAKAVQTKEAVSAQATSSGGKSDIYLGFPKGDYERPTGRKGRVIKDDPKKYPGKEDIGPLSGVVGGWAGGEVAIQRIRDELEQQKTAKAAPKKASAPPSSKPEVVSPNGEKIYLGFGKDEVELRNSGAKGRVIIDEPQKYPGKDDMGPLLGVAGGFAGGEYGLRKFVETGELRVRKAGEPGPRQPVSPLTVAFLLMFLGTGLGFVLADFAKNTSQPSEPAPVVAEVKAAAAPAAEAPAVQAQQ